MDDGPGSKEIIIVVCFSLTHKDEYSGWCVYWIVLNGKNEDKKSFIIED